MGRINAGILSVTFVALLVITMPTLAQENEHKEKPASTSGAATAKHSIWKEKGDGVWEAYIPRFADDEEGNEKPEFAVVRLTAERYAEFQKGSRDFLNDHKIFSHKLKVLESCTAAKPKKEEPKAAYWYLMVPHWPGSTGACQAYPGGSEPK